MKEMKGKVEKKSMNKQSKYFVQICSSKMVYFKSCLCCS